MVFAMYLLVVGVISFMLIAVSDSFNKKLKLEREKVKRDVKEEIYNSIRYVMAAIITYYPDAKIEYETLAFVKNRIQTKDDFPFDKLLSITSEIRRQVEMEQRTLLLKELANKTQPMYTETATTYKKPKKSKKVSKK